MSPARSPLNQLDGRANTSSRSLMQSGRRKDSKMGQLIELRRLIERPSDLGGRPGDRRRPLELMNWNGVREPHTVALGPRQQAAAAAAREERRGGAEWRRPPDSARPPAPADSISSPSPPPPSPASLSLPLFKTLASRPAEWGAKAAKQIGWRAAARSSIICAARR